MATLSYGSKGNDVSNLQKLLNQKGYNLSVDGIYGDKTLAAVRDWQKKNGYTVDGLVGPNTIRRLGGAESTSTGAANSTVQDIYNQLTGGSSGTSASTPATTPETNAEGSGTGESTSSEVSVTETEKPSTAGVEAAMKAAQNDETLAGLLKQMQVKDYTPLTPDQMKAQAENQYKSYYDQLRLASKQATDRQNLALENQKAGLQQTYDKQRKDSAEQFRQAYSQADRQSLSRGMQRSSYNNQTLSNIDLKAAEAQQDIYNAQTAEENKISSQQTQLAAQLADQLLQYDASEAADVLKRMDELEAREYDRQTTAENNRNTLTMQIYSILNDQLQKQVQYEQWLAEFNENVRQFNASQASSGGGYSGGGYYGGGYSSGYSKKSYSTGKKSSGSSSNNSGLYDAINASGNTAQNAINAINRGVAKANQDAIAKSLQEWKNRSNSSSGGGKYTPTTARIN